MAATQSFRLLGKRSIENISCGIVGGENVVSWEDINQVFPGIQYIRKGNTVVSMIRDSKRKKVEPHCIPHYPGEVLDVILSSAAGDDHVQVALTTQSPSQPERRTNSTTETPPATLHHCNGSEGNSLPGNIVPDDHSVNTISDTRMGSPNPYTNAKTVCNISQSHDESMDPTVLESNTLRLLSFIPEVRVLVRHSLGLHESLSNVLDGPSHVQEPVALLGELEVSRRILETSVAHSTRLLEILEDVRYEMTLRIKSALCRLFDPIEHLVPSSFIILPKDPQQWDPQDPTLRLYFICECGVHTNSDDSKTLHHIHLAKHEGYDIPRPKEFLDQYGPYVLTILQMLKFRISVAGITIPDPSQLVHQSSTTMELLGNTIESRMDQAIEYIEKVLQDKDRVVNGFQDQMETRNTLDGVSLHNVEGFLKMRGGEVLGNLFRTVTAEDYVKWVCIDHYRGNYSEEPAQAFREMVRSFDENIGRACVDLWSKVEADCFYAALERMKTVYELEIGFNWTTTKRDLRTLRDAIAKTNVRALRLHFHSRDDPTDNTLNSSFRYDPIFDIMRLPLIQSFAIAQHQGDLIRRSSLASRNDNFLNLKHLSIDLTGLESDIQSIKNLVIKAPRLSSLVLEGPWERLPLESFLQAFNMLVEHQTYPITLGFSAIRILPPIDEPRYPIADFHSLAGLFETHGERIECLDLSWDNLDERITGALVHGTDGGSSLTDLELRGPTCLRGVNCIRNMATIVSRSKLRTLCITLDEEENCIPILRPIQWEHIRELVIRTELVSLGTDAMRTCVRGMSETSGKIGLEKFSLFTSYMDSGTPPPDFGETLLVFVASTSLRRLQLDLVLTFEQMVSMIEAADFSRLQYLALMSEDFDTTKVAALLDCLHHATELRSIRLFGCEIEDEHVELMSAKGVELTN